MSDDFVKIDRNKVDIELGEIAKLIEEIEKGFKEQSKNEFQQISDQCKICKGLIEDNSELFEDKRLERYCRLTIPHLIRSKLTRDQAKAEIIKDWEQMTEDERNDFKWI